MKKLATLLAAALLLTTVFSVITLSSAADGGEVTGGYGYYYNQDGNPVMDFIDPADNAQVGTWWWWTDDALNATTRDKYLNFLEENSVNEIYYYGYYLLQSSSNRAALHTFVSEANRRGMVISFIYDDNDTIMGSSSELDRVCTEYLNYLSAYPDDRLNGIHFDVEHETVQKFANNLVAQFPNARSRGVPISMDVNCQMKLDTVSAGGVSGNIYEVIAANVDTLTLMSYKDTYNAIWKLGANAFAAAKKYGCRVVFGVETGAYNFNDPSDEFAQETKEYMYGELAKVYEALQEDHPAGGFGVAIHQHEDWLNLAKSATPITTIGDGKTEKPTVSHASLPSEATKTTQKPNLNPISATLLWSGDVNQTVTVGNPEPYMGRLSGDIADAINAAIRADIAENGVITGDEYYEITTKGYVTGSSGYATTGFVVNGDEQLWTEGKLAGTSLIQEADGIHTQMLLGTTTNKQGALLAPQMNETTEFVLFSDADGYSDVVYLESLSIAVYRRANMSETQTQEQPSETQPTGTEPSGSAPTATGVAPTGTEASGSVPTATGVAPTGTEASVVDPTATGTGAPSALLGDANGDDAINMKDVLALRKAIAGLTVQIDNRCADVNRDGLVNMKDVLALRKFLAGLIREF